MNTPNQGETPNTDHQQHHHTLTNSLTNHQQHHILVILDLKTFLDLKLERGKESEERERESCECVVCVRQSGDNSTVGVRQLSTPRTSFNIFLFIYFL